MKEMQLKVRIPSGLHGMIEKAAEKNHRSITGEVVLRLQQSFEKQQPWDEATLRTISVQAAHEAINQLLQKKGQEEIFKTAKSATIKK